MKDFPPYFLSSELECKCGCGTGEMNFKFMNKVLLARELFDKPFIITSAYRCYRHNKMVRGSPKSQHLKGNALDVSSNGSTAYDLVKVFQAVDLKGIGIAKTFIHVDNREIKALWLY